MEIESVALTNDIVHVKLNGRLDLEGTQAISDRFSSATNARPAKVIVDLANVTALSSIGIRLLLISAKGQASRGGRLMLAAPQPFVRKVLEAAGIDQVFSIAPDVESARASLGG